MDIKEAAKDSGKSTDTIRRWIKKRGLVVEKVGFTGEIYIDPLIWERFCDDNLIKRGKG